MKKYSLFLSLFLIMFFIVGGCDVEFGNSDDDDGGGGGGGGSNDEIVQGTITEVLPTRDSGVENITVVVIDEDSFQFDDTTTNSGFFRVEGNFSLESGNVDLEFLDADNANEQLAITSIDTFPGADLDLGNLTIENGNIEFENNDPEIDFEADAIEVNCDEDSGNLTVEIENGSNDFEIIVQVLTSTDIMRDNDDINCNDILVGQELDINGTLESSSSVEADTIIVN